MSIIHTGLDINIIIVDKKILFSDVLKHSQKKGISYQEAKAELFKPKEEVKKKKDKKEDK